MNDIEDAALSASLDAVRIAADARIATGERIILANAEARVEALMPGLDPEERQEAAMAIVRAAVDTVASDRMVATWTPEKDRNCATCIHCHKGSIGWTISFFGEDKSPGAGSTTRDQCSHPLMTRMKVTDGGQKYRSMPSQHDARRKGSACGNRGILWQPKSRFTVWRTNHEFAFVLAIFFAIVCFMMAIGFMT